MYLIRDGLLRENQVATAHQFPAHPRFGKVNPVKRVAQYWGLQWLQDAALKYPPVQSQSWIISFAHHISIDT